MLQSKIIQSKKTTHDLIPLWRSGKCKNGQRIWKDISPKEDTKPANVYMKRYSMPLAISKSKEKPQNTTSYPLEMTLIKKTVKHNVGE